MRKYLGLAIAVFFAATATSPAANAFVAWDNNENVQWQGPGYYVVLNANLSAAEVVAAVRRAASNASLIFAGPFANEANCDAAISVHAEQQDRDKYMCDYYATEKEFDM